MAATWASKLGEGVPGNDMYVAYVALVSLRILQGAFDDTLAVTEVMLSHVYFLVQVQLRTWTDSH